MLNFLKKRPTFELADIIDFHFKYSTGNMMNAYVFYEIKFENGEYTAIIKPNLVAYENALSFKVDKSFVLKIEALLTANNVEKWNGFKKSDLHVLDGYDFDMYIKNAQGQRFGALGYMKWPENYNEVKKGIDTIFKTLVNETDD